ncbi:TetR/AcrR family transcriptional regulator [Rhodobacteraceae bacterium CCMM004]|nr:TetR/AcrR family transcriptional regulator [Rhodobacteraceae bacterium CCMM004]
MPRPKLHSDDFILETALSVLLRKGPSAFTLTDVADAVGISRSALIQRFKDKSTLHQKVMQRTTQDMRDYFAHADFEKGLDPLWLMLKDLIAGMGSGSEIEGYLLLLWGDVQEPSLRVLAAERNRLVLKAIETRLPDTPHGPESTACLIQSVIQGSCMQWLVEPEGELAAFMTEQTRMILTMLYPKHMFA